MVLQMARPQKNPKSGVYYFRQKTPADLVAILGRKEVSHSLGTKDPEEAKRRNVEALRKQAVEWERLRKRPETLPHKQIVALSGVFYRDYMAAMDLEPGQLIRRKSVGDATVDVKGQLVRLPHPNQGGNRYKAAISCRKVRSSPKIRKQDSIVISPT